MTIDTNLIIRYLTEDDAAKATAVEKLIKRASKDKLELPDVIIAEVVWVLLSFYKIGKDEVIEKLEGLLSLENIKINRRVLVQTIDIFRRYNLSYTDAYLIAYTLNKSQDKVYSYDERFDKVKEIKRLEP